jgi:glutathione synthase
MRVAFVVNDRREPTVEQTTTLLVSAALRRGHKVSVCGVGDLTWSEDGSLLAAGCSLRAGDPPEVVRQLVEHDPSPITLGEQELCIVRTNPGRDESHWAEHIAALRLLERLEDRGVRVINSVRGLRRALTKLSLLELPGRLIPQTMVTRDPAEIERFMERQPGRVVIKPLGGTRGRDVFVLEPSASHANRAQIIEVVLRQGYAMVQEFVPGAELGDLRVTVVAGELLELDGHAAAIARVPRTDDFRSNLHAGGRAEAVTVSSEIREAVAEIAPHLEREGLVHVGFDFVGGLVLELNVFSPGGLYPGERLYDRDFSSAVVAAFERLV